MQSASQGTAWAFVSPLPVQWNVDVIAGAQAAKLDQEVGAPC